MKIDPRLEASVADPLPSSPGSGVYSKLPAEVAVPLKPAPDVHPKQSGPALRTGAEKVTSTAQIPAQLRPPAPAKEQDHFGLLME
jgi:hypothetical protein